MTPEPSYREIQLTQGQVAKVSPHRFEEMNQYHWQAHWDRHTKSFYAQRGTTLTPGRKGKRRTVAMHRQILGLEFGDKRKADHRNHDTLDNTDGNLRISTTAQNNHNIRRPTHNTTGFKGVYIDKESGKYGCCIRVNGKTKRIGRFPLTGAGLLAAAQAYDAAATEHFGEFAHINFPHTPTCERMPPDAES